MRTLREAFNSLDGQFKQLNVVRGEGHKLIVRIGEEEVNAAGTRMNYDELLESDLGEVVRRKRKYVPFVEPA